MSAGAIAVAREAAGRVKTLKRQRDAEELLRRLRTVRPDTAPRWGRMNAHQMICHLADAFRMALGRKQVSPSGGVLHRTLVKWMALHTPLRWRPGILTRPEIDQHGGGTRPAAFAADLAEVAALLEVMAAEPPTFDWPPHPIFGRLSHAEWMRWGYLHTDHHLRQFGA